MTVAFDNSNKKVLPQGDPNPWMTMEADRKDEVQIFGSYTILVNSIIAIEIVSKKLDSCLVLFHVRNGNAESKKNNLEQGNQHGDLKQRR